MPSTPVERRFPRIRKTRLRDVDQEIVDEFFLRAWAEQDLPMAILGGMVAALIGAIAWGALTWFSGIHNQFLAMGIELLVGFTVRWLGKGIDRVFGLVGLASGLLGFALGELISISAHVCETKDVPFFEHLVVVFTHPEVAWNLIQTHADQFTLLFLTTGLSLSYHFAFRPVGMKHILAFQREMKEWIKDIPEDPYPPDPE